MPSDCRREDSGISRNDEGDGMSTDAAGVLLNAITMPSDEIVSKYNNDHFALFECYTFYSNFDSSLSVDNEDLFVCNDLHRNGVMSRSSLTNRGQKDEAKKFSYFDHIIKFEKGKLGCGSASNYNQAIPGCMDRTFDCGDIKFVDDMFSCGTIYHGNEEMRDATASSAFVRSASAEEEGTDMFPSLMDRDIGEEEETLYTRHIRSDYGEEVPSLVDIDDDEDDDIRGVQSIFRKKKDQEPQRPESEVWNRSVGTSFRLGRKGELGKKNRVKFGDCLCREFDRVIDTDLYMGLSLGWDYVDNEPITIANHQDVKKVGKCGSYTAQNTIPLDCCGGELTKVQKKLPHERFIIFIGYGYTRKQLKSATNESCRKLQNTAKYKLNQQRKGNQKPQQQNGTSLRRPSLRLRVMSRRQTW